MGPDERTDPKIASPEVPVNLRDYFAGLAMNGLLRDQPWREARTSQEAQRRAGNRRISEWAYEVADAMLAARDGARDAEAEMGELENQVQEPGYRDAGPA